MWLENFLWISLKQDKVYSSRIWLFFFFNSKNMLIFNIHCHILCTWSTSESNLKVTLNMAYHCVIQCCCHLLASPVLYLVTSLIWKWNKQRGKWINITHLTTVTQFWPLVDIACVQCIKFIWCYGKFKKIPLKSADLPYLKF